jgi:tellurite resistance protein TerC
LRGNISSEKEAHIGPQVIVDAYRRARRIAIAVVGGSVVVLGIAMLVLPGPAIIVIPAGLAILGLEFAWARRWLRKVKRKTRQTLDQLGLGGNCR